MTTTAQQLQEQANQFKMRAAELVEKLRKEILALPDNPRISRATGNPRCFVMSSSNLGDNWSAEYHDFGHQHRLLADAVDRAGPLKAAETLRTIARQGYVRTPCYNTPRKQKLHPDVVAQIEGLLG